MEIEIKEIKKWEKDAYTLVDMRDLEQAQKNPIEDALVLSEAEIASYPFD